MSIDPNSVKVLASLGRFMPYEAYSALRTALEDLTTKLRVIEQHPAYKAVWSLADVHRFKYDGPDWKAELEAAEKVLAEQNPTGD